MPQIDSFDNIDNLCFCFQYIQHVEPVVVAQKVIQGVYPGVTTMELDE